MCNLESTAAYSAGRHERDIWCYISQSYNTAAYTAEQAEIRQSIESITGRSLLYCRQLSNIQSKTIYYENMSQIVSFDMLINSLTKVVKYKMESLLLTFYDATVITDFDRSKYIQANEMVLSGGEVTPAALLRYVDLRIICQLDKAYERCALTQEVSSDRPEPLNTLVFEILNAQLRSISSFEGTSLTDSYIKRTLNERNVIMKGFMVERTTIAAIYQRGVTLNINGETIHFEPTDSIQYKEPNNVTKELQTACMTKKPICILALPVDFNYRRIDAMLITVIEKKVLWRLRKTVDRQVLFVPIQITMQSPSQHRR